MLDTEVIPWFVRAVPGFFVGAEFEALGVRSVQGQHWGCFGCCFSWQALHFGPLS